MSTAQHNTEQERRAVARRPRDAAIITVKLSTPHIEITNNQHDIIGAGIDNGNVNLGLFPLD